MIVVAMLAVPALLLVAGVIDEDPWDVLCVAAAVLLTVVLVLI